MHRLQGEARLLAGDGTRGPSVYIVYQVIDIKFATANPEVTSVNRFQHCSKQGTLWYMAIFTRKDLGHQPLSRFIDD
jgi:hypothetical protein